MSRSLRRHHKNRMKAKAKKVYHWLAEEHSIKYADHLKICSCFTCSNRRKHEGLSIQELKNLPPSSNWQETGF